MFSAKISIATSKGEGRGVQAFQAKSGVEEIDAEWYIRVCARGAAEKSGG